jgi:hypothetical protein
VKWHYYLHVLQPVAVFAMPQNTEGWAKRSGKPGAANEPGSRRNQDRATAVSSMVVMLCLEDAISRRAINFAL